MVLSQEGRQHGVYVAGPGQKCSNRSLWATVLSSGTYNCSLVVVWVAVLLLMTAGTSATHSGMDSCSNSKKDYTMTQAEQANFAFLADWDTVCFYGASKVGGFVCKVLFAPPCPTVSKETACATIAKTVPERTHCLAALRVFQVDLDKDCDYDTRCEYLPSTAAPAGAPTVSPAYGAPPAPAAASLIPTLLPKPGDVVVTSFYAVGTVRYSCVGSYYSNATRTASLYATPPTLLTPVIGVLTNVKGQDIFDLDNLGNATVISTGGTYAQPPSTPQGGLGDLNRTYSRVVATGILAATEYITQTATSGGLLPAQTRCIRSLVPDNLQQSWSVPFEANYTFYSTFSTIV